MTRGGAVLNKLQVAATLQGDQFGLNGLSVHARYSDGSSPSQHVGKIQIIDSIVAEPLTQLLEAWAEKKIGSDERPLAIRAGLMDLNADFDSIQAASLLVNSSHGIGADLSRSADLVEELCRTSPEFEAMWADNDLRTYGDGVKRLRHPIARPVTFEYSSFAVDGRPDLAQVVAVIARRVILRVEPVVTVADAVLPVRLSRRSSLLP